MQNPEKSYSLGVSRADWAAAVFCALIGILFSVLPHLIWWPDCGAPIYIADNDNLDLQLTAASQAYFGHPAYMTDTVRDRGPSVFPNYQFVPGVLAARALSLGPLGVNLVWRVWAGFSIGLAWFVIARQATGRTSWALAVAMLLIADRGVIAGKPLVLHVRELLKVASNRVGDLYDRGPLLHQWRLITPGLSLATLLLFVWLVLRARERGTRGWIIAAGLGLGLLFHAYFYYWTAAIPALGICWLLDSGKRRVFFHTGWIGVLVGLPAVLASRAVKAATNADWLPRNDFFLPIPRFSEISVPVGSAILVLAAFPWVWRKRRDLLIVWSLAAAALLLMNHQVVTGLYIQNHHWAAFVLGPMLSALLLLIGADMLARLGFPRSTFAGCVVWALVAVHVGFGLWLRGGEARASYTVQIMNGYLAYKVQRAEPGTPALEPKTAVAGDPLFVDLAIVLDRMWPLAEYAVVNSSQVDNAEWDERVALNAILRGLDRSGLEHETKDWLAATGWGPWRKDRDPKAREARLQSRLAAYDRIDANPESYRAKYGVEYVALPISEPRPPRLSELGFAELQSGPTWRVWGRGRAERQ
jgi:hypothetical protein